MLKKKNKNRIRRSGSDRILKICAVVLSLVLQRLCFILLFLQFPAL